MSGTSKEGEQSSPNPTLVDVSTDEGIDFKAERDRDSESWERADPHDALIEPFARFGYRVMFQDGDVHYLAFALEDGGYTGRCDCPGYEYHDGLPVVLWRR